MKYFFDIFDGDIWVRDDFGLDCRDASSAKNQALLTLLEMAREQLPIRHDIVRYRLRVRERSGAQFIVKLDVEVES